MTLYLSRLPQRPLDHINFLTFNQNHTCLAVGTNDGFRIFNCDPGRETFKRDFSGGIGIVEMLFRCNILALVGGGSNPAFGDKSKVTLWDDNQKQAIGELRFKSEVKAVKLRKDRIVVALENYVSVYQFDKLERTHKFPTCENEMGLLSLSSEEQCVMAFPHTEKGEVCVAILNTDKTRYIRAHNGKIQCLSLNSDGSRLATASQKGTLIRIFDTFSGTKLQEVRRGTEKAIIYCISFNHDSTYLCTSSDKGTIHIFSTGKSQVSNSQITNDSAQNRKSKISFFGGYFKSEWSLAFFKVPSIPSICCFGEAENTVVIWCSDGSYYRVAFDPRRGGEAAQKKYAQLWK